MNTENNADRHSGSMMEENENRVSGREQRREEDALVTLIDCKSKEVDRLRRKTNSYQSQLAEAERILNELNTMLARLRHDPDPTTTTAAGNTGNTNLPLPLKPKTEKETEETSCPNHVSHTAPTQHHSQSTKIRLIIPAVKPKPISPITPVQLAKPDKSTPTPQSNDAQSNGVKRGRSSTDSTTPLCSQSLATCDAKKKKMSAATVRRETKDLIPSIRTSSSPFMFHIHSSIQIGSQHKRRLRSLELNPVKDKLFCTSALDGVVNLWELQSNGSAASVLSATNGSSLNSRWPEDIVWHPDGDHLFAAYTADDNDSQVSILNFNAHQEKKVIFLEGKPHTKGVINNIDFMPWTTDQSFATGGSDHAVVLWNEKDNPSSWKPEIVHSNLHSSSVSGVVGLEQKKTILSVGKDKRIIGFNLHTGKVEFKHQIESACLSIRLNPFDFNLFMVQTGAHEKQLRLFDIRLKPMEIHWFGWKQESSESHSALINQEWSSDGFCISSGSADPMIHIFDIRYNGCAPAQSVPAHQKRVFKAAWHPSLPLLISISSDSYVQLHNINLF